MYKTVAMATAITKLCRKTSLVEIELIFQIVSLCFSLQDYLYEKSEMTEIRRIRLFLNSIGSVSNQYNATPIAKRTIVRYWPRILKNEIRVIYGFSLAPICPRRRPFSILVAIIGLWFRITKTHTRMAAIKKKRRRRSSATQRKLLYMK